MENFGKNCDNNNINNNGEAGGDGKMNNIAEKFVFDTFVIRLEGKDESGEPDTSNIKQSHLDRCEWIRAANKDE